jgi:hypothetical protein
MAQEKTRVVYKKVGSTYHAYTLDSDNALERYLGFNNDHEQLTRTLTEQGYQVIGVVSNVKEVVCSVLPL